MPVLDTSLLIDLQRGEPAAEAALRSLAAERVSLFVPAQVALEYLSGLEEEIVGLHMLQSSYDVVAFAGEHVLEGARLARDARLRGVFPGWPDVQIAALARLEDTYVVTSNPRHFAALGCAVWDPRSGAPPPAR